MVPRLAGGAEGSRLVSSARSPLRVVWSPSWVYLRGVEPGGIAGDDESAAVVRRAGVGSVDPMVPYVGDPVL